MGVINSFVLGFRSDVVVSVAILHTAACTRPHGTDGINDSDIRFEVGTTWWEPPASIKMAKSKC